MMTDKNDVKKTQGAPKGRIFLKKEWCKGCSYCIAFCPTHCLIMGGNLNLKGYTYPEVVAPEKCSGCNLCGLYCPDFAIFGVRSDKEEGDGAK